MGANVDEEFSEFVAAASARLVRIGTLLTGDPHLAQDLVQTALTKTYVSWPRAAGDPFRYVRRVMINQRTDWWRRRKVRSEVLTPMTIEAPGRDDFADLHATRDTLLQALRMLTKRERTVLVLRFFEDMSEAQVADELGIAVGTVKSSASRGLAKLRVAPELASARRVPALATLEPPEPPEPPRSSGASEPPGLKAPPGSSKAVSAPFRSSVPLQRRESAPTTLQLTGAARKSVEQARALAAQARLAGNVGGAL